MEYEEHESEFDIEDEDKEVEETKCKGDHMSECQAFPVAVTLSHLVTIPVCDTIFHLVAVSPVW